MENELCTVVLILLYFCKQVVLTAKVYSVYCRMLQFLNNIAAIVNKYCIRYWRKYPIVARRYKRVAVSARGCGFDFQSRKWDIEQYFYFFAPVSKQSGAWSSARIRGEVGSYLLIVYKKKQNILCTNVHVYMDWICKYKDVSIMFSHIKTFCSHVNTRPRREK